jgi:hypothetical protein
MDCPLLANNYIQYLLKFEGGKSTEICSQPSQIELLGYIHELHGPFGPYRISTDLAFIISNKTSAHLSLPCFTVFFVEVLCTCALKEHVGDLRGCLRIHCSFLKASFWR